MMQYDAHQPYGSAFRFLKSYLLQTQRLLFDGVTRLERAGYHMLRPNGERLVGNLDTLLRDPETWQAGWLACFFVKKSVMGGSSYGAPASSVDRVLFLELNLDASDESDQNVPALWLGWVQDFEKEGQVESQLQSFFWEIDYEKLPGTPPPVASLDAAPRWSVAAHVETGLGVALVRVPLRLIDSSKTMRTLVDRLLESVRA